MAHMELFIHSREPQESQPGYTQVWPGPCHPLESPSDAGPAAVTLRGMEVTQVFFFLSTPLPQPGSLFSNS